MNFEPINKWITLKPISEEEKVGSLFLPHNVQQAYSRATVLAVPPNMPAEVKIVPGDTVFYDKLGEVRIGRGVSETILVSYQNVLGVVKE